MKTFHRLLRVWVVVVLLVAALPLSAAPSEGEPAADRRPERIVLAPPSPPRVPCADCVAETDIRVYKVLADGLVAPGEVIEYKISVEHDWDSNAPARDIIITDTLPLSVTYLSQSNNLGLTPVITTGGQVVWTRPFLNPDESGTIYMQVRIATSPTVKPGNTLFNTVEITSSDPDIEGGNNIDSDSRTVVAGVANVNIAKAMEPSGLTEAPQGEEVVYKITFGNTGDIPATDVVLTDTLPLSTTFRAWSSNNDVDAPNHELLGQVITPSVTGQDVVWHLGDLETWDSGSIYAVVYVSETVPLYTVLTNTARIATSAPEAVMGNNYAEVTTPVVTPTQNVAISAKSLQSGNPVPGGALTYGIAFQAGASANAPARGVVITDTLPLGTTFVSWANSSSGDDQVIFGRDITATVDNAQVVWHIGTLRPGRVSNIYPRIYISDTVAVGAWLTNTAHITSTTPDVISGDHIKTHSTTVTTPTLDIGVNKAVQTQAGVPGGEVEYRISFENYGDLTAHDVLITDTLPENTEFFSWSTLSSREDHNLMGRSVTEIVRDGHVIWPVGSVQGGESDTIYLTLHISEAARSGDTLTNVVRIVSRDIEGPDTQANVYTNTETAVAYPMWDVSLAKTLRNGAPVAGTAFEYRLTFRNSSNVPAHNVVVTDTLPGNVSFQDWTGSIYNPYDSSWADTITKTQRGDWVIWHLGTLDPGRYGYLYPEVYVTDTAQVRDVLCNHATITTSDPDSVIDDNVVTDTLTVYAPVQDMYIAKSLAGGPGAPDGRMTYEIYLRNQGNFTAHDVMITDTLPSGVSLVSWFSNNGKPYALTQDAGQLTWQAGDVAGGESDTLLLTVYISDTVAIGTVLTNTVEVTSRDEEFDVADNTSVLTTTVASPSRDMYVYKYVYPSGRAGAPGGEMKYRISFSNYGNMPAADVVISDTLPENTHFVAWSARSWEEDHELLGETVTETVRDGQVAWRLDTVDVDESDEIYLTVYISDTVQVGDVLTNTVWISTADGDIALEDNIYTETVTVVTPTVDLDVAKSLYCSPGAPGGEIVYSISVYNQGNVAAESVVVTDTLPVSTTYVADQSDEAFTTIAAGPQVVWAAPSLKGGHSAQMLLRVRISDTISIGDILTNTIAVTTTSADENWENNTRVYTTTVTAPTVDLSISKAGPMDAEVSGWVDYKIYVYNGGNWTASDVIITDTLPMSATYRYDFGWLYDTSPVVFTPTITTTASVSQVVWHVDALPACAYGYLYPYARVDATAQVSDVLTNTVVITSSNQDVNLDNNMDSATTHVTTPTLASSVSITGPVIGTAGTSYAFTATVEPPTATMPIEYVWHATEQHTVTVWGDYKHIVDFTWGTIGTKYITVTAEGGGNVVMDTHSITLSAAPVCTEVTAADLQVADAVTLYTNTPISFTANITPDDMTPLYYYRLTLDGTPGAVQTSRDDPLTFEESFATTGVHTVTIAVWNCALTETNAVMDVVTFTVDVSVGCVEVTDVNLSLSPGGTIYTDTVVTFAAEVIPNSATKPYTYRVAVDDVTSPVQATFSAPLVFSNTFATPGVHTVTLAVWNCALTETDAVTGILTFTVYAPGQCVGLTDVAIDGPNLVDPNTATAFSAVITPSDATSPMTYTWHPAPNSGQGTAEAVYQWADPGFVTLSLTVENCGGGSFTARHLVLVRGISGETSPIDPDIGTMLVYTYTDGLTTTIEVPPGAVERAITLIYTPIPSDTLPPPPTGLRFSNRTFDLSAFLSGRLLRGYNFSKPVTITLRYSDADIRGLNESQLTLQYWDEEQSQWLDAANNCPAPYIRRPEVNLLAVPICHLTAWGMLSTPLSSTSTIYLPLVLRNSS